MFRVLTPIVAIVMAVGLLVTYVRPTFLEIKDTQEELTNYTQAIAKAGELQALLQEKINQRNSFSPSDIDRLETMVPADVHPVSRLLDLDTLARAHNMELSGISVADDDSKAGSQTRIQQPQAPASDASIDPLLADAQAQPRSVVDSIKSTDISFKLTGSYEDFRSFLDDTERSLVLMDVVALKFQQTEGDKMEFELTLRAYSFNGVIASSAAANIPTP